MAHPPQTPPSRTRTYVITFITLGILTFIEFGAATLPSPIKLPALLGLASIKAVMVAGIYMHLRYDSKVFTAIMILGLLGALTLVTIFTFVLSINWGTTLAAPHG